MTQEKIFIGQEQASGDFLMRLPEASVADLYKMIVAAPLEQRRTFHQVKTQLEEQYKKLITDPASATKPEKGGAQ